MPHTIWHPTAWFSNALEMSPAKVEHPAIVRQILDHLGILPPAPSLRAPPDPPDGLATDPPREWSSEPLLDDLPVPAPVLG